MSKYFEILSGKIILTRKLILHFIKKQNPKGLDFVFKKQRFFFDKIYLNNIDKNCFLLSN